ncbi:biotin/lipoyl-containing protein, partial [Pseudomonas sp. FSL R10-2172]
MAKLLHMPEVSANATHAAIQNWAIKEGETIAVGDCIAEIETEKALVELAAEEEGVLGKILVAAGREVEVGSPIGVLFAKGESNVDIAALLAKAVAQQAAPAPVADEAPVVPVPVAAQPAQTGRVFASP